jgi:hypothetical protein
MAPRNAEVAWLGSVAGPAAGQHDRASPDTECRDRRRAHGEQVRASGRQRIGHRGDRAATGGAQFATPIPALRSRARRPAILSADAPASKEPTASAAYELLLRPAASAALCVAPGQGTAVPWPPVQGRHVSQPGELGKVGETREGTESGQLGHAGNACAAGAGTGAGRGCENSACPRRGHGTGP